MATVLVIFPKIPIITEITAMMGHKSQNMVALKNDAIIFVINIPDFIIGISS